MHAITWDVLLLVKVATAYLVADNRAELSNFACYKIQLSTEVNTGRRHISQQSYRLLQCKHSSNSLDLTPVQEQQADPTHLPTIFDEQGSPVALSLCMASERTSICQVTSITCLEGGEGGRQTGQEGLEGG